MELEKVRQFIIEADKLKRVHRKTLNYHEDRYENSAEHSWHLALSVLASISLANEKNLDVLKCIKMALIHDLVEIEGGDQIIYADDPNKFERELQAAKNIFGLLPKDLGEELLNTWIAFEKKECAESQFVGALDRYLPLTSNVLNDGHSWRKHNITLAMIEKMNKLAISQGSKSLWEDAKKRISKFFVDGKLKD